MFKANRGGLCAVKGCNVRPRGANCCAKHGEHEDAYIAIAEWWCHNGHVGVASFKWCKYCVPNSVQDPLF